MMPLLTIDSTLRTITLNQRAVSLTAIEFDLLDYLSRHHDRYHTALDLLASVWDYPPGAGDTALVRNHIHNLRHKLENDPDRPRIILSLHGRGYRLNAEVLRNEVVESAMS
jgi:DNA-binding response OmpR family regulator